MVGGGAKAQKERVFQVVQKVHLNKVIFCIDNGLSCSQNVISHSGFRKNTLIMYVMDYIEMKPHTAVSEPTNEIALMSG